MFVKTSVSLAFFFFFLVYSATKSVSHLVEKLPNDGTQKYPSNDVVINICGVLNNLVTYSSLAARDINFFGGIEKLMGIKNSHDGRSVTWELDKVLMQMFASNNHNLLCFFLSHVLT